MVRKVSTDNRTAVGYSGVMVSRIGYLCGEERKLDLRTNSGVGVQGDRFTCANSVSCATPNSKLIVRP